MSDAGKINVLELRLSGVKDGTYHVDGLVDGQSLLRGEDEEMNLPFGLLPSTKYDGYCFMVTCSCGDAGCAGYFDPVLVTHEGELIHWSCEKLGWEFTFNRDEYESVIRNVVNEARAHLRDNPKVESIHQNVNLFKSRNYQEYLLPERWEAAQKRFAEWRLRKGLWENDPQEFRKRYSDPWWRPAFTILILIIFLPVIVGVIAWGALRDLLRAKTKRGRPG